MSSECKVPTASWPEYLSTDRPRHARHAMTRQNFIFRTDRNRAFAVSHTPSAAVTLATKRENP